MGVISENLGALTSCKTVLSLLRCGVLTLIFHGLHVSLKLSERVTPERMVSAFDKTWY